ncbi:MAG: hypothetical protein C9356_04145 [Oleiphilus sp.]|nr:MAG: hypothetical protein C9356_04145 [Oleiphilus sp.]
MLSPEVQLQPLFELFEHSCLEAFESLGCQAVKVEQFIPKTNAPCAWIDSASEELQMTLCLRGPVSIIEQTHPASHRGASIMQADLDDWIAELANRFMGQLKNKLLVYDHRLKIGVPQSCQALDLHEFQSRGDVSRRLFFQSGAEVLECSLHAKILVEMVTFIYHSPERYDSSGGGGLEML